MKTTLLKRATVLVLAALIVSPATLFADDKKPAASQEPAQASTESGVGAPKGKLADDENPLMIGKRAPISS